MGAKLAALLGLLVLAVQLQGNAAGREIKQIPPLFALPGEPFTPIALPPFGEPLDLEPCLRDQDLEMCEARQVCVPLQGDEDSPGVCAQIPVGGVAFPAIGSDFPLPVAYFPLTGGSLASWPQGKLEGASHKVEWRKDDVFGSVPHCNEVALPLIVLPNVKFGRSGHFSINLWVRKDETTSLGGAAFQYVLSMTALANANIEGFPWDLANQIHVYIPETQHPSSGIMRTIVQDSDDGGSVYFLDTDGSENRQPQRPPDDANHADLDDGEWHMITLTSREGDGKGYIIYVDGKSAAESTDDSEPHGGHPLVIDGDIFLCGRVDQHRERHFDGSVTQFSIYDTRLTANQVKQLYQAVTKPKAFGKATEKDLTFVRSKEVDKDQFVESIEMPLPGEFYISPELDNVNRFDMVRFAKQAEFCDGNDGKGCGGDEVCSSLHSSPLKALLRSDLKSGVQTGICAKPREGKIPAPGPDIDTPVAMAYYPLTGGDLRSWPIPEHQAFALRIGVIEDEIFGSVVHCSQANLSLMILDDISYGDSGEFAVNLWFRPRNVTGPLFQYIFSHGNTSLAGVTTWGEQLNVYLGETGHRAFGLVRAIYKDHNDNFTGEAAQVYIDSDGEVGVTQSLDARKSTVEIIDGNWHMLTISTNPVGEKGYRMYLDAKLVGEVEDGKEYKSADGVVREIVGGDPFTPDSNVHLCGRHDGHPERHFEGEIAQLSLFDTALKTADIKSLFDSIPKAKLRKSRKDNVAPDYDALQIGLLQPIPPIPPQPFPPTQTVGIVPGPESELPTLIPPIGTAPVPPPISTTVPPSGLPTGLPTVPASVEPSVPQLIPTPVLPPVQPPPVPANLPPIPPVVPGPAAVSRRPPAEDEPNTSSTTGSLGPLPPDEQPDELEEGDAVVTDLD